MDMNQLPHAHQIAVSGKARHNAHGPRPADPVTTPLPAGGTSSVEAEASTR